MFDILCRERSVNLANFRAQSCPVRGFAVLCVTTPPSGRGGANACFLRVRQCKVRTPFSRVRSVPDSVSSFCSPSQRRGGGL